MKWIVTNWKIKLISLVIAIAAWGYVRDIKMDTINISVPVSYEKLTDKLSWKNEPPRYIELRVRGRKEDLQFPTASLKASVNLSNATAGRHSYAVRFDPESIPEKIEIVSLPKSLSIQLEDTILKKVLVVPKIVGAPAQGFKQGDIAINPKFVTIESTRSHLKKVETISTDPIDITNAQKSLIVSANISVPKNIRIVDYTSVEVRVNILPEAGSPEKVVTGISIEVENLDPALKVLLSNTEIKIYVSGDPKILKKINSSSFQAYIDLDGTRYNPKTGSILPFDTESEIPVKVRILTTEKSIKILKILPDNLTVRFSVKAEFVNKPEDENGEKGPN